MLPLTMVMFYTAFQLLTSYMARTESPMTMHFYTGWVGTAAVSCLVYWHWSTDISPLNWALLVMCGLLGSMAHYLFILAFYLFILESIHVFTKFCLFILGNIHIFTVCI